MSNSVSWFLPLAWILLATGCVEQATEPPTNVKQLEALQAKDPNAFTNTAIVLHNARRVLDAELPEQDRLASLEVLSRLDEAGSSVNAQLASLLSDPQCPETLRLRILSMLIQVDYPELAPFVIRALPNADETLRAALLDWLTRNPAPQVLAEVVKLWAAADPEANGNEERYRRLVEAMTGRTWSDALLNAINQDAFVARGSALEILAQRIEPEPLKNQVLLVQSATPAIEALQYYIRRFNYLPRQRNELLQAVVAYVSRRDELEHAGLTADAWAATSGYRFNIRDFHLLAGLQQDTVRRLPPRSELIVLLASELASRAHTLRPAETGVKSSLELKDNIVDLTMADLANLYLFSEMLSRPRVQAALQVMAKKEGDENIGQWGGLIFYDNGRAEARLYRSTFVDSQAPFAPSDRMIQDAASCMAFLSARFGEPNAAGPTREEVDLIDRLNCYGLTLSTTSNSHFTAVYYNGRGVCVSLGDFPLPAKPE